MRSLELASGSFAIRQCVSLVMTWSYARQVQDDDQQRESERDGADT